MKVFITGIEGFVGEYLTRELINNGHDVSGFHYHLASAKHLDKYGVRLHRGDVLDREKFWSALDKENPDAVIHLAAITFVPQSQKDPIGTWQTNFFGTLNLLEWARQQKPGTKILLVSSGEIYGAPKSDVDLPFTEKSCPAPTNIYSATKAACETAAIQYRNIWQIPIVIARSFNHIGPGQSENFVTQAFAKQIAEIALGKSEPIVRVGNLSAERDFTDVRDVVRAYRMLISNDIASDSPIFNICSGKAVMIQLILDSLIKLSGKNIKVQIDRQKLRPIDTPIIYGSYQKLLDATGWKPKIALKKSLSDIFKWWMKKLK